MNAPTPIAVRIGMLIDAEYTARGVFFEIGRGTGLRLLGVDLARQMLDDATKAAAMPIADWPNFTRVRRDAYAGLRDQLEARFAEVEKQPLLDSITMDVRR